MEAILNMATNMKNYDFGIVISKKKKILIIIQIINIPKTKFFFSFPYP